MAARHTPDGTPNGGAESGEALLQIDQVATRTGLTKRTLRYYEEIGLLEPPTRTEGGYRLYSEADIHRVESIKRLRHLLGFSLAEIRDLVRADEERARVRDAWRREESPAARLQHLEEAEALVRGQMRLVEAKLAGLTDMRATLRERLDRYDALRAQMRAQIAEGH
ncbi:MAG TPA: MerR family transcriptional regulator [Ktedonobacterales bacterium]|nr:MerR family transcriptional regulator [Ktedonobacterales bacterium]